jgi:hypothetical protein
MVHQFHYHLSLLDLWDQLNLVDLWVLPQLMQHLLGLLDL